MARKKVEEQEELVEDIGYDFDTTIEEAKEEITPIAFEEEEKKYIPKKLRNLENYAINPLRNERIIVRFLPKSYAKVTDTRHVLYGGMSESSKRTFVVPINNSGTLVEVLTPEEQAYLENIMGLEEGDLSVLRKKNNYWIEGNGGISKVTLEKRDNILDLSSPEDFIRYKILLANKETIAPSLKHMEDFPKATYQFVLVSKEEEQKSESANMTSTMQSYMEFGKISDDKDKLRFIVEIMNGRSLSRNINIDQLKTLVNQIIQSKPKNFLSVVRDDLLDTKVLLRKAVQAGIVGMRGNYFFLREGNIPLCPDNAEPTLNVAAAFLNMPKNKEMLFTIQAKVNQ